MRLMIAPLAFLLLGVLASSAEARSKQMECMKGFHTCMRENPGKIGVEIGPGMATGFDTEYISLADGNQIASFGSSPSLDVAVWYQLSDLLAPGFEFGYQFEHKPTKVRSDFDANGHLETFDIDSDLRRKVLRLTPTLKIGKRFGSFMPYGVVGMGLYHVTETSGRTLA